MATSQENSNRTRIIVAIIAAFATVLAAILGGPLVVEWLGGSKQSEATVTARVADSTGASISGANVILFWEGGPLSKYTDANGTANFTVSFSKEVDVRLIIESDRYEIYEREIQLSGDKVVYVRLKEQVGDSGSVIVRVVDDSDGVPIPGAEVLLLVEGDVYSQPTDSNGIAKFTVTFPGGKIDAQMSVSTKDYEIDYQRITLLPNKVQDIRLNPGTGIVKVSSFTEPQPPTSAPIVPTDTPASAPTQPLPGSISGTVTYTGSVIGTHRVCIEVSDADTGLYGIPRYSGCIPGPGSYTLHPIADGTYYVTAWLDADDSGGGPPTDSDRCGWFGGGPDMLIPVVISGGTQATGIDIVITDAYSCVDPGMPATPSTNS